MKIRAAAEAQRRNSISSAAWDGSVARLDIVPRGRHGGGSACPSCAAAAAALRHRVHSGTNGVLATDSSAVPLRPTQLLCGRRGAVEGGGGEGGGGSKVLALGHETALASP